VSDEPAYAVVIARRFVGSGFNARPFSLMSSRVDSCVEQWITDRAMAKPVTPVIHNTFNQNFYGVREKQTAYQAYRATQRAMWGVLDD